MFDFAFAKSFFFYALLIIKLYNSLNINTENRFA